MHPLFKLAQEKLASTATSTPDGMLGTFISAVREAVSAAFRKLLALIGYGRTPIHEPEATMEPTQRKPSIFISSTVYDFADLRSSLKYYYK